MTAILQTTDVGSYERTGKSDPKPSLAEFVQQVDVHLEAAFDASRWPATVSMWAFSLGGGLSLIPINTKVSPQHRLSLRRQARRCERSSL